MQQPPYQPPQSPKRSRRHLWLIVSIAAGVIILSCVTCGIIGSMASPPKTAAGTTPTIQPTQPLSQVATEATALAPSPTPTINSLTPTPTPTSTPTANMTPTSTPIKAVQPTPTPTQAIIQPTPTPTHPAPTPTPKPQPTPTQCVGVNGNPWCYDFSPGNLIYYPPNGFCNYFNCITTFYSSDDPGDGYIIECQDGTYSQSGGESGACSYHGGELRPLYSH